MKKQLVIIGITILLICIGLSGCTENTTESNENDTELKEKPTPTARIGDTIPEIGTSMGKHNLSMTLLSVEESNICVDGPYASNEFYTFTARGGMKFIILIYKIKNEWIRSQITPDIGYGEILTDKGYYYNIWNPPVGIWSEEYQPKKSNESEIEKYIGEWGILEELLPEESILGCIVFEIPDNQTALEISISKVPSIIKLE